MAFVRSLALVLLIVFSMNACMAQAPAQFEIATKGLPDGVIDRAYSATLQTSGGTLPLSWKLVSGKLPSGLSLNETTGLIAGTPTQPGMYTFKVSVTDSSQLNTTREFTITIQSYLVVEWQEPTTLSKQTIEGSIEVENYSKDTFDLTVIVVAVNRIGKAFALGYERLDLAPSDRRVIPFSSSLPNGAYVVHADAIAEVAARNQIYRKHLQTDRTFVVNVNR